MARSGVFSRDTSLWHPDEGWRVFPKGETDPGAAWSEHEGGGLQPGERDAATLREIAALAERAERAEATISRYQADKDRLAQERDDIAAEVANLSRRANEAEKALKEAQADKARYAAERDRAIQNEANMRRELDAAKAEIAKVDGDGDGKVGGRKPKARVEDGAL